MIPSVSVICKRQAVAIEMAGPRKGDAKPLVQREREIGTVAYPGE
jgi:hypothetical protein